MSEFVMQIIHRQTGKVVSWAPGLDVEVELIDNLIERVRAKRVGWFRSEAKVVSAVQDALNELLYDLKRQV